MHQIGQRLGLCLLGELTVLPKPLPGKGEGKGVEGRGTGRGGKGSEGRLPPLKFNPGYTPSVCV